MMPSKENGPEWTLEEKKKLLELWKSEDGWPERSEKMNDTFPPRKGFFSPESCQAEFDLLMSAPAPVQVTIPTDENTPGYSLKSVVDMWIGHYKKEIQKDIDTRMELCIVDIRNSYAQADRVVNNEFTDEQLKVLLEEARIEEAKYGMKHIRNVNAFMHRLIQMEDEKKKDQLPTDLDVKEESTEMKMEETMSTENEEIPEIKTEETMQKEAKTEEAMQAKTMLTNTLNLVKELRHSNIFFHPVSEKEAPGYSNVIKQPMDFLTIKKEIDAGEVSDLKQLKHRCMQMFANAVMYNNTGSDINTRTKEIARDTIDEMARLHSTRPTRAQSSGTVLRRKRPAK